MALLQGQFDGLGDAPRLLAAEGLSETRVRLTFSEPMLADEVLGDSESYSVLLLPATPVPVAFATVLSNSTHVVLELAEPLSDGAEYDVAVSNQVRDLAENAIDPAHVSVQFVFHALGQPAAGLVSRYLEMLIALLPPGRLLRDAPLLQTLLAVGARALARLHAIAAAFLERESDPAQADQLLPSWEELLGLPDPCRVDGPSVATRQTDVLARLTQYGDQRESFWLELAERYGYAVGSVETFRPFRVGSSAVGDALHGDAWTHAFRFPGVEIEYTPFQVGQPVGTPLRTYEHNAFACAVARLTQAHTLPLFDLIEVLE